MVAGGKKYRTSCCLTALADRESLNWGQVVSSFVSSAMASGILPCFAAYVSWTMAVDSSFIFIAGVQCTKQFLLFIRGMLVHFILYVCGGPGT